MQHSMLLDPNPDVEATNGSAASQRLERHSCLRSPGVSGTQRQLPLPAAKRSQRRSQAHSPAVPVAGTSGGRLTRGSAQANCLRISSTCFSVSALLMLSPLKTPEPFSNSSSASSMCSVPT